MHLSGEGFFLDGRVVIQLVQFKIREMFWHGRHTLGIHRRCSMLVSTMHAEKVLQLRTWLQYNTTVQPAGAQGWASHLKLLEVHCTSPTRQVIANTASMFHRWGGMVHDAHGPFSWYPKYISPGVFLSDFQYLASGLKQTLVCTEMNPLSVMYSPLFYSVDHWRCVCQYIRPFTLNLMCGQFCVSSQEPVSHL